MGIYRNLPRTINSTADRLRHDLVSSGQFIQASVTAVPVSASEEGGDWMITIQVDGSALDPLVIHSFDYANDEEEERLVGRLADQLQDDIAEDRYLMWPLCPAHNCPLQVQRRDRWGDAEWLCERDQAHWRIGDLPRSQSWL